MPNLEYVDFLDVATLASVDDLDETTRKDYYDFEGWYKGDTKFRLYYLSG